jgi:hypothetical protein
MKRIVVLLALLVGGCDLTASQERATAERADDAGCLSYGLKYGSPEYAQCRLSKDQQRQAKQAAVLRQVIRNNQETANQLQPAPVPTVRPSVNCTTIGMGGGISSTSCQ